MAALSRLQSSVDRMDTRFDQMHAFQVETRVMVEGLNTKFDTLDSRVTHMDERLTEYQQQRVPLTYQRFGRGSAFPPSLSVVIIHLHQRLLLRPRVSQRA